MKNNLNNKIENFFEDSKNDLDNSEDSRKEEWETGMLWWKEKHSKNVTLVKSKVIRDSLKNLISKIEDSISKEADDKIINSKKILLSKVVPVLREKAGDKNIDIHQIEKVVRNTIKSIVYPEINYTSTFPKELDKGGKLEGSEAEEFIESANNYISNFQTIVKKDVKSYISLMTDSLKKQNLGEDIISNYVKDIERLENDINNKELSLTKYKYILEQLGDIKC